MPRKKTGREPGLNKKLCQLWKFTLRYMFADDICNACYFIWGHNVDDAEAILENIVHWPPFEVIEAELLDIHKPLNLRHSIEQQLGIPPTIARRKGYEAPVEHMAVDSVMHGAFGGGNLGNG